GRAPPPGPGLEERPGFPDAAGHRRADAGRVDPPRPQAILAVLCPGQAPRRAETLPGRGNGVHNLYPAQAGLPGELPAARAGDLPPGPGPSPDGPPPAPTAPRTGPAGLPAGRRERSLKPGDLLGQGRIARAAQGRRPGPGSLRPRPGTGGEFAGD